MPKISSGLLMYKFANSELKVFLVHPGGPFWKNKDEGAWSVPKGEVEENEDFLDTAKREFSEEVGFIPESDNFIPLGEVVQKSGKIVHCWAFQGDWSGLLMTSSFVTIEYPVKSGKFIKIPEIDKAQFFPIQEARKKINPSQKNFLDRLEAILQSSI
ncbi:MAG: NUDIX domain-containing protein [Nanoarchaeota archaeon]|nr:NUDIX domain-containing protein [Nanoarchaeota archaeon]